MKFFLLLFFATILHAHSEITVTPRETTSDEPQANWIGHHTPSPLLEGRFGSSYEHITPPPHGRFGRHSFPPGRFTPSAGGYEHITPPPPGKSWRSHPPANSHFTTPLPENNRRTPPPVIATSSKENGDFIGGPTGNPPSFRRFSHPPLHGRFTTPQSLLENTEEPSDDGNNGKHHIVGRTHLFHPHTRPTGRPAPRSTTAGGR